MSLKNSREAKQLRKQERQAKIDAAIAAEQKAEEDREKRRKEQEEYMARLPERERAIAEARRNNAWAFVLSASAIHGQNYPI